MVVTESTVLVQVLFLIAAIILVIMVFVLGVVIRYVQTILEKYNKRKLIK